MSAAKIVDVHAHMLSEDMMKRLAQGGAGARLRVDRHRRPRRDACSVGSIVQTPYARGGWDLDKRLADMEAAGIDMPGRLAGAADVPLRSRAQAHRGAVRDPERDAGRSCRGACRTSSWGSARVPMQSAGARRRRARARDQEARPQGHDDLQPRRGKEPRRSQARRGVGEGARRSARSFSCTRRRWRQPTGSAPIICAT